MRLKTLRSQSLPLLFPDLRVKKVRRKYVSPVCLVRLECSLSWIQKGDFPASDNEQRFIDSLYESVDMLLMNC